MKALDSYMEQVNRLETKEPLFEKIEIEVNVGCNRRCSYCFLATKRRESIVTSKTRCMQMSLFVKLLSQLRDLDFCGELDFHFYGEPLLNKRLAEYVRMGRDQLRESSMVLYTNGDLLTLEKYRELQDAGITTFYVTFHDDLITGPASELISKPDVVYDTRSSILLNNRGGYLSINRDVRIQTLPCIYPSVSVIVTIDGNVLPCSCDFDEKMCFGNILQQHLVEIWKSEKAHAFRRDLLKGRRSGYELCQGCDYYSGVIGLNSVAEPKRHAVLTVGSVVRNRTTQTEHARASD